MSLPPGPRLPAIVQGLWFIRQPVGFFEHCRERYGDPFTLRLPSNPDIVLFSDPAAIREIFTGDEDVLRAGAEEGRRTIYVQFGRLF